MALLEHYLFLSACGYLTGLLCLTLAILVLHANPRSRSCQLAFLFNSSVALWAFSFATMFLSKNDALGMFISQMVSFSSVLLSTFVTHFVLVQVNLENKRKKIIRLNYIASAIISILIFIPGLTIAGSPLKFTLPAYSDAGPLYSIIPIQLFANFIYSAYLLVQGIKKARGYKKSQLCLFLAAIMTGYLAGTPAYLLVYDIPHIPVTAPLVSLYPIILTYAIVKHRFLDIEKLVKNTLIFSFLFVILLAWVSFSLLILKELASRWIGIPETVSQGIAVALAIGLYGPLKEALSRLTHRLLFQHAENPDRIFKKLSEDILRYLDSRELAQEVTQRLASILALDRIGFYWRMRRAPHLFELKASVGRFRKTQIHPSKQLAQYLERTKEFLINPLTPREWRMLARQKPALALTSFKEVKKEATKELAALGGLAAFPVLGKGSLRGILVIGRKKSDAPWRDEEFRILNSFISHLSIALRNAEYAEGINLSRQELVRSEREASAGALIAGVDHEVKNPLHTMSLHLSLLRSNLSKLDHAPELPQNTEKLIVRTMEHVLEDVAEVNAIIEHLSDLAERKPIRIEEGVRPAPIADKVIRELKSAYPKDKVRIESRIPESLSLACDPNTLYEILANLVRNALQATANQGEVVLEGSRGNGAGILQVKDTGAGIPHDLQRKIFEPFFTTKKHEQAPQDAGSGMGLFIVKESMQGMGGRVEFESEEGRGTCFRLIFPSLAPAPREPR